MSLGKGAKPDNSAVVDEQRQQAAEEAAKEAARQARINTGLASIKQAFEGSPVMASQNYDWSNFKAPQTMPAAMSAYLAGTPSATAPDFSKTGNVPAGYTAVRCRSEAQQRQAGRQERLKQPERLPRQRFTPRREAEQISIPRTWSPRRGRRFIPRREAGETSIPRT